MKLSELYTSGASNEQIRFVQALMDIMPQSVRSQSLLITDEMPQNLLIIDLTVVDGMEHEIEISSEEFTVFVVKRDGNKVLSSSEQYTATLSGYDPEIIRNILT